MRLPIFQVDAFTDAVFGGNPAAVCELPHWLPDDVMQKIAEENAVAETAFFCAVDNGFEIRWFTPELEIDLCGHATLATAHVITHYVQPSLTSLTFYSQSGELTVDVNDGLLTLNFPCRKPLPSSAPQQIFDAFHVAPKEVLKSRDYLLVFEDEETITNLKPNQTVLNQLDLGMGGISVTAKGNEVDFVSRFFTPQASIFEDPVTGSAHCSLIPYWSEKLSKNTMVARQISPRAGTLYCENLGERVLISGKAVTYLKGHISI